MNTMYDSVTVGTVPTDCYAAAGYTSGNWPTYLPLCRALPRQHKAGRVVSIAIHGGYDADALDIESGDASPSEAAGWVERQLARGLHRPIVYTSISDVPEVMSLLRAHGIARSEVRVWSAHRDERPHLCGDGTCGYNPGFIVDATQYTWTALGRNLDASRISDSFFTTPKPPFDPHYGWYLAQAKVPERAAVEAYDKLRNRPRPFIVAHRSQLAKLRAECKRLAERVAKEATEHPLKDGKPSWGQYHRGFRYQGLIHRAEGKRIPS